jgi:hypothetical protein
MGRAYISHWGNSCISCTAFALQHGSQHSPIGWHLIVSHTQIVATTIALCTPNTLKVGVTGFRESWVEGKAVSLRRLFGQNNMLPSASFARELSISFAIVFFWNTHVLPLELGRRSSIVSPVSMPGSKFILKCVQECVERGVQRTTTGGNPPPSVEILKEQYGTDVAKRLHTIYIISRQR